MRYDNYNYCTIGQEVHVVPHFPGFTTQKPSVVEGHGVVENIAVGHNHNGIHIEVTIKYHSGEIMSGTFYGINMNNYIYLY